MHPSVSLEPIAEEEYDSFVKRLQTAFTQAARARFPEFLGSIPPASDIDEALNDAQVEMLGIVHEGEVIGGAVVTGGDAHKRLEFIFIDPDRQNLHLGQAAWQAIEARYPNTKIWELETAYHEKRNIHFYVNKCGFHIVEYFNKYHEDPDFSQEGAQEYPGSDDGLFRFVKVME